MANSPWRGRPAVKQTSGRNSPRQRKALAAMSVMQLECGISEAEFDAWQAEQRRLVRERYGLREAA